jgi:branched-chain amino acid transport system ATP-binding protein
VNEFVASTSAWAEVLTSSKMRTGGHQNVDALLATDELTVTLSGIRALQDVTLKIPPLTISGLIGPNGAGKSTLLNAVSGLVPVTSGDIYFGARRVTGRPPHVMARLGLGRSFQGVHFIRGLSVVENVMAGDHLANTSSFAGSALRTRRARRLENESRERAIDALRSVGVEWTATRQIGELPFGVQKRVDISRALVGEPTCLLLDEPFAGLSVKEKQEVAEVIQQLIHGGRLSIVLVEHDMRFVNMMCSYIVVLDAGQVLAFGDPTEVMSRPEVIDAYVGGRSGPQTDPRSEEEGTA